MLAVMQGPSEADSRRHSTTCACRWPKCGVICLLAPQAQMHSVRQHRVVFAHSMISMPHTPISDRPCNPHLPAHRTGDTAAQEGSPAYWRILGRTSVDIIKSGGYKISALGIEDALLGHPGIAECAVLSLPDKSLGESIAAIVAWHAGQVIFWQSSSCSTGS